MHIDAFSEPFLTTLAEAHKTPFCVLDVARGAAQAAKLQAALPGVNLLYAVKSFPNVALIRHLHTVSNIGFDVASLGEVRLLVDECGINFNAGTPVLHSHPIKHISDIVGSMRAGVSHFVYDNVDELHKFIKFRSRVSLFLRISFENPNAMCNLSSKFGAPLAQAPSLLDEAQALGIHVKGICFHTGSQQPNGNATAAAIRAVRPLFDAYPNLAVCDIGGGFPCDYVGANATADAILASGSAPEGAAPEDGTGIDIDAYCAPIREAMAEMPSRIEIVCEPGRYISSVSMACVTSVMGRAERRDGLWLYLDDGVYNTFSGQLFDGATYPLRPLHTKDYLEAFPEHGASSTTRCIVAGPTCDSVDIVRKSMVLPPLPVGTKLVAKAIGAYTAASATGFNGYPITKIIVVNDSGHATRKKSAAPVPIDSSMLSLES